MLALRRLSRRFGQIGSELDNKIQALNSKLQNKFPYPEDTNDPIERKFAVEQHLTSDEKLETLDFKVANIEELREAGRPEEVRIRNLDNKYGRTGRHPAYPWYGSFVKKEDRIPHLADRIGSYSRMTPIETALNDTLQIHNDLNKPQFESPFVAPPSRVPDPDITFERGEVLYENKQVENGLLLFRQLNYTSLSYFGFNMIHTVLSGRATYPIGNEFNDQRSDTYQFTNFLENILTISQDWGDMNTISLLGFLAAVPPALTYGYLELSKTLTEDFIVKLQYNADRSLIFVTRVRGAFFTQYDEIFHEEDHLKVLPPSVRAGNEKQADTKVMTLTCLNTKDSFHVYKDPAFWHKELRLPFMKKVHSLWSA